MAELQRGRESLPLPPREHLLISVVICSYTLERLKDIQEVLDSLAGGTYPRLEIIVVTERDRELQRKVEEYMGEKKYQNVQVIFNEGRPSLARARNLGIERATGDIIAFLDDDAVPFPDWAQELVNTYLSHPEAVGVTGPAVPAWQGPNLEWLPTEFHWLVSSTGWFPERKDDEVRVVRNGWGMNLSMRRDTLGDLRFTFADWAAEGGNKLGLEGDDLGFECSQFVLRRP